MVVKSVNYFWVATVYIRVPLLMLSMKLTTLVSVVATTLLRGYAPVAVVVEGSVGTVDVEAVAMVDAAFVIAFIVEYILLI